jgi:hypothetical protein
MRRAGEGSTIVAPLSSSTRTLAPADAAAAIQTTSASVRVTVASESR